MISAAVDTFYLTDEQLHNSPSRKDGIDEATKTTLRIYGCDLIQESGILLRIPQHVMATGQVLFHRFYCKTSFVRFNVKRIVAACIWLASRQGENPRRARDVINVFQIMEYRRENLTLDYLDASSMVQLATTYVAKLFQSFIRFNNILIDFHKYIWGIHMWATSSRLGKFLADLACYGDNLFQVVFKERTIGALLLAQGPRSSVDIPWVALIGQSVSKKPLCTSFWKKDHFAHAEITTWPEPTHKLLLLLYLILSNSLSARHFKEMESHTVVVPEVQPYTHTHRPYQQQSSILQRERDPYDSLLPIPRNVGHDGRGLM
ncbi:hypothetical protein Lser_V15G40174 [Lactuca serriola]